MGLRPSEIYFSGDRLETSDSDVDRLKSIPAYIRVKGLMVANCL